MHEHSIGTHKKPWCTKKNPHPFTTLKLSHTRRDAFTHKIYCSSRIHAQLPIITEQRAVATRIVTLKPDFGAKAKKRHALEAILMKRLARNMPNAKHEQSPNKTQERKPCPSHKPSSPHRHQGQSTRKTKHFARFFQLKCQHVLCNHCAKWLPPRL